VITPSVRGASLCLRQPVRYWPAHGGRGHGHRRRCLAGPRPDSGVGVRFSACG